MVAVAGIRILEGIANDVRNNSAPGPYGGKGAWFNLGHPPERVMIPGDSIQLNEGDYVVVAVRPTIVFRLFPQKKWARSDVTIAYSTMNMRGDIQVVGYLWIVLRCLLCVCGLVLGYLVTRGSVPSQAVLDYLPRTVQRLLPQSPDLVGLPIALISIALGFAGISRLSTIREARAALVANQTVRQAQERSTT
jgi:hypothetical protein